MDVGRIVERIESGEWKLERFPNQAVSFVKSKKGVEPYMVRRNYVTTQAPDKVVSRIGFDPRTRTRRDAAMYLLDQELGLGLVPEVRAAKIQGEEVSIQVKVKGREFFHESDYVRYIKDKLGKSPARLREHKQDLENLGVFDLVGGNMDRNITNFIYDEKLNRIRAIDNADSMPLVEKTPGMIWFWSDFGVGLDQPIEAKTRELILSLNEKVLTEKLGQSGLLEPEALVHMKTRIHALQEEIAKDPLISMEKLGRAMDRRFVFYRQH